MRQQYKWSGPILSKTIFPFKCVYWVTHVRFAILPTVTFQEYLTPIKVNQWIQAVSSSLVKMECSHSIEFLDDEIVLPKEYFVMDVFTQLRRNSGNVEKQESCYVQQAMDTRESLRDCRRGRPTLQRTLSHETTLKRKKREHVRNSLDEELLNAEWASYSPEERQILDFVIRNASLEESKSNQRKKSNKLQRFRIKRPKIFSRGHSSEKTPELSFHLTNELSSDKQNPADVKGATKKPWFIRRFIGSGNHPRSPSASPKPGRGRQPNDSPNISRRKPTGNPQVHALVQGARRSSSLQCLSASSFSVADEVTRPRAELSSDTKKVRRVASDAHTKRGRKEKIKLFRAHSTRQQRDFSLEESDTFFEIFDRFCRDPMALIDATEIDC